MRVTLVTKFIANCSWRVFVVASLASPLALRACSGGVRYAENVYPSPEWGNFISWFDGGPPDDVYGQLNVLSTIELVALAVSIVGLIVLAVLVHKLRRGIAMVISAVLGASLVELASKIWLSVSVSAQCVPVLGMFALVLVGLTIRGLGFWYGNGAQTAQQHVAN